MERLAIIDHSTHTLFIEDVSEESLNLYNGEEEAYIEDNYNLESYSWEYIIDAQYIPFEDRVPIEINFEEITDI